MPAGHAWTTDYGCSDKEEEFEWLIKWVLCPLNLFFWSCTTRLAQHTDLMEIWVVTQNHVGILGVQTLVKVFGSCIVAVMAVGKWPPPVWKYGSSTRGVTTETCAFSWQTKNLFPVFVIAGTHHYTMWGGHGTEWMVCSTHP
jgi:hypothetical protein